MSNSSLNNLSDASSGSASLTLSTLPAHSTMSTSSQRTRKWRSRPWRSNPRWEIGEWTKVVMPAQSRVLRQTALRPLIPSLKKYSHPYRIDPGNRSSANQKGLRKACAYICGVRKAVATPSTAMGRTASARSRSIRAALIRALNLAHRSNESSSSDYMGRLMGRLASAPRKATEENQLTLRELNAFCVKGKVASAVQATHTQEGQSSGNGHEERKGEEDSQDMDDDGDDSESIGMGMQEEEAESILSEPASNFTGLDADDYSNMGKGKAMEEDAWSMLSHLSSDSNRMDFDDERENEEYDNDILNNGFLHRANRETGFGGSHLQGDFEVTRRGFDLLDSPGPFDSPRPPVFRPSPVAKRPRSSFHRDNSEQHDDGDEDEDEDEQDRPRKHVHVRDASPLSADERLTQEVQELRRSHNKAAEEALRRLKRLPSKSNTDEEDETVRLDGHLPSKQMLTGLQGIRTPEAQDEASHQASQELRSRVEIPEATGHIGANLSLPEESTPFISQRTDVYHFVINLVVFVVTCLSTVFFTTDYCQPVWSDSDFQKLRGVLFNLCRRLATFSSRVK
ncbi:hypothetical protein FA10DRAFT_201274 [Acaromyces ingoldii]|uniref:Uncharacterized protein n=1 Tax=Acaromyces ingoldii TaxID=215250 RepID=A0A316YAJ4_9BASI|nr:hypothetical protein FA10DRAFT_201274 [Acaromyces ingoldii]PWN86850.1 hypothetical protein FA10DRAFT_201274 [Acaromyces ingoldii]